MIVDHIENCAAYAGLPARFVTGLEFLRTLDFNSLATGRNEIEGENLYALKQEYVSRPVEQGKWEAHERYADIQFVVGGEEKVGYAPLRSVKVLEPYQAGKDCALFEGSGDFIRLGPGQFAVFFPQDVHMPCLAVAEPSPVKKIVIKVLL